MDIKEQRELNDWIHRQVVKADQLVGLKKRGYWYRPEARGYTDRENEAWHITREEAKKHEYPRGDESVTICEFNVPDYSTDPAAAMEVLKKCASELDSDCDIEITPPHSRDGENWLVIDTYGEWKGSAPTLELAICLFARKLFGKEAK